MKFEIAPKSTEIKANREAAILYCTFLEVDGKKGWCLPTRAELNKIWKKPNDFECEFYWTSTEDSGDNCWTNGMQIRLGKNNRIHVRAVRSLS